MKLTRGLSRYMRLPQGKNILAEYIWIGGTGQDLRSKTRTFDAAPKSVSELPDWAFDGSSTAQAEGHTSEVLLRPVKTCRDPFREGENILVLCECYDPETGAPHSSNTRSEARRVLEDPTVVAEDPWFGLEQEYTMFDGATGRPLGWPELGYPGPQGPYYCANGTNRVFGRDVVEAHLRACMYAGLDISGVNAEVMPGQWEYQIGAVGGIDASDQTWLSRYILYRLAEDFGVEITLEPKPIKGDWNGAGCHCNYSTKSMREDGGYALIEEAMEQLKEKHLEHMAVYGDGNEERMTGHHETAKFDRFTWGIGDRGVSVRVQKTVKKSGKGYFEDRRPAANCDPYLVTSKLVETTVLKPAKKN